MWKVHLYFREKHKVKGKHLHPDDRPNTPPASRAPLDACAIQRACLCHVNFCGPRKPLFIFSRSLLSSSRIRSSTRSHRSSSFLFLSPLPSDQASLVSLLSSASTLPATGLMLWWSPLRRGWRRCVPSWKRRHQMRCLNQPSRDAGTSYHRCWNQSPLVLEPPRGGAATRCDCRGRNCN